MPRIEAPTIQEHVRLQTERLLDAASAIFRRQGFHGTDMGDIAAAVGLARNSLYRYYANKEHILVACVQRDMGPFLAQIHALETRYPDARARIDAWIDLLIDIATGPSHATMDLISEIREASPDLRRQILELHKAPNTVLETAVRTVLGRQRRDSALLTAMIAGMVQSGAGQAIRRKSQVAVKQELKSAVARLLRP
ncbi:MAG: TetR/AcrR family transcriptional regulator [Gammaproteobacteria bacterium]|nr:TetR/AcrR family transcriptional regulator [Gammaproteobacteria bacterium]